MTAIMVGLNHDFLLLARKDHPIEEWKRFYHNPDAVKIHDDVLLYMSDTLKWIPTYNPATKRAFQGLCWYGPTIILQPGAEVAARVFSLWANLLNCGPSKLELTGAFEWKLENDPDKDGFERVVPHSAKYENLTFERDKLVEAIRDLASYADRVQQTQGEYYILHLGI